MFFNTNIFLRRTIRNLCFIYNGGGGIDLSIIKRVYVCVYIIERMRTVIVKITCYITLVIDI